MTDAPNLTATLEGPLTNNSILLLGDNVWVNGSAFSLGTSPVPLTGDVQLAVRANGSGDTWLEVFNVTVTGTFKIPYQLPRSWRWLQVRSKFECGSPNHASRHR